MGVFEALRLRSRRVPCERGSGRWSEGCCLAEVGGLDSVTPMLTFSAPILALGVLWLDLALGPVRFGLRMIPAPPVLLGRIALGLSRRLDRPNRSDGTLRARGAVLGILLCGGAALMGLGIERLAGGLPAPLAAAVEGLVFWGCLRAHLPLARLRGGVRRLGNDSDDAAHVRSLLEQTAISFVHFVVGPIFWFLLAGLPGALAAAAAWALDRAAGQNGGRRRPFGAFAAGLEHLLSWIPGRIAELVLAVAAIVVPRGRPILALRQGWSHVRLGQFGAVAALAGGLGVALPGPPAGDSGRIWLGDGTARVGRNDLLRATWLYLVALLVVTGLLILAALIEQASVTG